MNFSLTLAVKFPEEKKNYESSENQKLKYDRNVQLTNSLFQLTLFFVWIKQQAKAEVRIQPFKCVPR